MFGFNRARQYEQLLGDARRFKQAGNLTSARQAVIAALGLYPRRQDALALLKRIRLLERLKTPPEAF